MLKEELEILRGEPINVFDGDPMDIPCIETSDREKLCRHPVVSIWMVAYNHEPYIRQAIEGVVRQKTDFEFELVIGEDCSLDKTREICFEYQKKYPDKVRVLWWHENVRKFGGNGRRVRAHCRGEFIAFCEGDDFWTDSNKLQCQVDIMRSHPNVTACFGGVDFFYASRGDIRRFTHNAGDVVGVVSGHDFLRHQLLGSKIEGRDINAQNLQTSAALVRAALWNELCDGTEIGKWILLIGDKPFRLFMAMKGDVFLMDKAVSRYNIHSGGVTHSRFDDVMRDDLVVRLYFSVIALGMSFGDAVRHQEKSVVRTFVNRAAKLSRHDQKSYALDAINGNKLVKEFFSRPYACVLYWLIRFGLLRPRTAFWLNRIYWHMPRFWVFR